MRQCLLLFLHFFLLRNITFVVSKAIDENEEVPSDFVVPVFEIGRAGVLKIRHLPGANDIPSNERTKLRVKRTVADNEEEVDATKLSVDVLILADYSIHQDFMIRNNNNSYSAEIALQQYFTNIMWEVARIYASVHLEQFRFKIWPSGVVVAKHAKDSPWIPSSYYNKEKSDFLAPLDAYDVLVNLKHWLKENGDHLPEYDHVVAFTKKDLARQGDHLAQGIAYVRSICHRENSASVAEDVGAMATVAVIAHEVAHSLGADHDGTKTNKACPVNLNYLMVPAVSSQPETIPNSFTFSSCSLKQIFRHLKKNPNETKCLYKSPRDNTVYSGPSAGVWFFPGQIYDVNQQCQQAFGKHYRFCGNRDFYLKRMCGRLWCQDTSEGRFGTCYSKHYLPALYGTSCGHHMWCVNGACVEDAEAPAKAGCKFGDRDGSFCASLIARKPRSCKSQTFKRFCCESCSNWAVFGRTNGIRIRRHKFEIV